MADEKKYLDYDGLLYVKGKLKTKFESKVSKDGNKVLSDNNYTTEEKNKLAGIEEGANNYTLPAATSTTIGGVKPGAGLEVLEDGTINATGGGTADSVDWENVQGKPTTISGYGITDAKIENKKVTLGSNSVTVPSNTSELTNDSDFQTSSEVSSAVSEAVADKVTNTQMTQAISTATEDMATKTYVNQQLSNINKKQIVTSTTEMTDANTIYLIANKGSGNNIYDEYIVYNGKPEKVGTTEVDLTNYYKEGDLVGISNGDIDTIFADL